MGAANEQREADRAKLDAVLSSAGQDLARAMAVLFRYREDERENRAARALQIAESVLKEVRTGQTGLG